MVYDGCLWERVMPHGSRPPLLAMLYLVGVFAAGLITWAGLVDWGWPLFDAAGMAVAVAVLALWASLGAGRAMARRRRPPPGDRGDR